MATASGQNVGHEGITSICEVWIVPHAIDLEKLSSRRVEAVSPKPGCSNPVPILCCWSGPNWALDMCTAGLNSILNK